MATNDFVHDLVSKLAEENIEYMVIAIQKGKDQHRANAYFNICTIDGADMVATTIDEVFRNLGEDESPGEIEIDLPDRDDDFKEGAD